MYEAGSSAAPLSGSRYTQPGTGVVSFSLKGQFLLSMPALQGSYFQDSLTLMCEHNEDGALGLIVNRPLSIDLHSVLEQLDITLPSRFADAPPPVYEGGPVGSERGFLLHSRPLSDDFSMPVTDGLYLSAATDALREIIADPKTDFLLALGYAGWGAGQLETELGDNAWLTCDASAGILFQRPPAQRLQAAADQLGIDYRLLAGQAGHA